MKLGSFAKLNNIPVLFNGIYNDGKKFPRQRQKAKRENIKRSLSPTRRGHKTAVVSLQQFRRQM